MVQRLASLCFALNCALLASADDYHEPMKKANCHETLSSHSSKTKTQCGDLCDNMYDNCKGYAHRGDTNHCILCASTKPKGDNSYQTYFKQEFTCAVTIYNSGWVSGEWRATYVGDEAVNNYWSSRTHSDYDFNAGFLAYGAVNDQMSSLKVVGKDCIAAVFQHQYYDGWQGTYATNPGQTNRQWDVNQYTNAGAVNDHASSVKVRKLNCGRHGSGWEHGVKNGMRAGTEDIIDNCPSPNTLTQKLLCANLEYAYHKCPVSCEICTKADVETSTNTQTTVTGTTVTATTATATTTTTVTTISQTTQTETTLTTTQTTLTFTDSKTTVTDTTNTATTLTQTTETATTHTDTTTTTETGTTATLTTATTTGTTRTGTTVTATTITLTTTTIGPATFPIPVNSEAEAQDLFHVVKNLLDENCFPDETFEDAFNDDRIRLEEVESGKRYIWDGGAAPDGAVYPMMLKIWVNESHAGTKPDCTVSTPEPVSSGYNVAPAAIMLMLVFWIA